MILQRLRPGFEVGRAARRHRSYPPDGLRNHGRGDALGLSLQHAENKRPTDALAIQVALVDPQVVEEGNMIGQVAVPAVLSGNGRTGLATGVTLIHGDHPEIAGELFRRVHRRGGTAPDGDDRLQASGREGEDREALAELLVVNGRVVVCKAWHGVSFRYRSGWRAQNCEPTHKRSAPQSTRGLTTARKIRDNPRSEYRIFTWPNQSSFFAGMLGGYSAARVSGNAERSAGGARRFCRSAPQHRAGGM